MRVLLVGPSGVGKSTVGARLAAALDLPFQDSDDEVARLAGVPLAELFARHGEPGFRALEREALAGLLAGPPAVIAIGAGAPAASPAAFLAAPGTVVHLDAAPPTLATRLGAAADRPLLAGAADLLAAIEAQHRARASAYLAVARFTIATDALSPDAVTQAILRRLPARNP